MNKGIILDFDGVIIRSVEVQRKAFFNSYNEIIGKTNRKAPSFEEFLSHGGDSLINILKKMDLPQEMIVPYRRICRENIKEIQIFDGIVELLIYLKKADYKIGLCTGKDRERTLEILAEHNLDLYFDAVVCSDDVVNPKPHMESLIKVIQQIQSSLDKSIMIGDAVSDILCGKSAKVKTIAVLWGDGDGRKLKELNPDYIVANIKELKSAIKEVFC